MSLYQSVSENIQLDEKKKTELIKSVEEGYKFFSQFNRNRMELAFSIFSEEMRKALFEVIFFLHVNDPKFKEHTFISKRVERVHGVLKEVEYEAVTSLYVKDSPAGVVGIGELAPVFKDDFDLYTKEEFGTTVISEPGFAPIYSIASLGSIGTIGHKETASDLDLQVQYELEPFLIEPDQVTDEKLKEYALNLARYFSKKYQTVKKYSKKELQDKKLRARLKLVGYKNLKKRFPRIYEYLFAKEGRDKRDNKFDTSVNSEFVGFLKYYSKTVLQQRRREQERLLKQRINKIQSYVQKKFPEAEVYLFAYSNDDYRNGKHGTTLESKEASGSAYELILNYEVLMPGIQFTPMIPIHFLLPATVNSHRPTYENVVDHIRLHFTDLFDEHRKKLVDLGATPPLTKDYLAAHSGAIYWESFKASSGNLPKAMLNLLRFEMLFDERFNTSVIELVKNPRRLDKYSGLEELVESAEEEYDDYDFEGDQPLIRDDFYDDYGLEVSRLEVEKEEEVLGEDDSPGGLAIEQVLKLENKFPTLRQDPWWLRYKALKIGFGPENDRIEEQEEKDLISRVIDLGFALHIRVSDVFGHIREGRKLKTYREKVLAAFLKKAFTKSKRRVLEFISNGEVDSVIRFEKDLKYLFQRSMKRVEGYVEEFGGVDKTNREENKIWYHYYQKNFDPPKNVIRRDILSHLKVPRGRLQIGINEKQKWFFRSIQKSALAGSRYNTFGQLDHLPDEVDLFEHHSFLHGIAHCLLNGYYGVLNKGTLKESRTILEYAVAHTEIGKMSADQYAYIRPDIVDRLFDGIDKAFPPQEYDFRDCIYKEKEITNIFICLNLLEYGRVSFMYRDNLKNWFVDEYDHPQIEKNARELYQSGEDFFQLPEIQRSITNFFIEQGFDFNEKTVHRVSFWVNPNSLNTYHSADKFPQKEEYLAKEIKRAVIESNTAEAEMNEEVETVTLD